MNRRQFVAKGSLVMAGAWAAPILWIAPKRGRGATHPVVDTTAGRVRGIEQDGVYAFRGVPYAASTAGANRFLPPRKPQPWAGVRDCLDSGPMCPQVPSGLAAGMGRDFGLMFGVGPATTEASEDCLALDVFTPGLGDGGKRPVMVWIHGGGFDIGTGSGPRSDGTHLAHRRDVVSVSINHRIGVLGYCHLGDLDSRFAQSGNVGQLDIVAALEWVRDNIEAFGGDPRSVLVHGESGGGAKIHTLMAMPAAKGLFHRAICQSGVIRKTRQRSRLPDRAKATEAASLLLEEAGLSANQVEELQRLPVERVIGAAASFGSRNRPFAPVMGTADLPEDPNQALANGSARVPFMVGCTKHEATFRLAVSQIDLTQVTDEGLRQRANEVAGERAEELIEGYRVNHPSFTPSELLVRMMSDRTRFASIEAAEAHIQGGGAPTFMYLFTWESPALPHLKSAHGIDGCFYFDNTNAVEMAKGNSEAEQLAARASTAWTHFARSGNPSHRGLGTWPQYTLAQRATMILSARPHVANDPMDADRLLWERISGKATAPISSPSSPRIHAVRARARGTVR